jgi:integral membrane protein (TIGR01906 family)
MKQQKAKMKYFSFAARILFILALPAVFLCLSLTIAFNSQWLYQYGFDKYDVAATTGLEQSQLELAASGLIDYFNSGDDLIELEVTRNGRPMELFNQREVLHLKDVKFLVHLNYTVLLACGLYAMVYSAVFLARSTDRWPGLMKNIILGGVLNLVLIGGLGLIALMDFHWFFLQFHLISFTNDLWLLDPAKDYLIMLFPQGFWFDATLFVALSAAGWSVLAGGLAAVLFFKRGRS